MKYLVGIDLGTSSTKSVLFDTEGNVIKSHSVSYDMSQPQNGWAEQDPMDWWMAAKTSLEVITEGVLEDVAGIGLAGQMHGLVMLDENGEVLRPSIIWCDQRTGAECEYITKTVGAKRLIEITANPALTGFTASKILWVRNNEPEVYAKCKHILLPKDYVRYKLTGEFATEVSDASGMQLLDIKNRCWSDEVLDKLEIDKSLLAKVYESPDITGYWNGIPVVGGAGDNAAAAVGTGVVVPNTAFTTIGTSGVVFAHTDEPIIDESGRVHTFCCSVPGKWHVMGVTQAAGLSLKWAKDNFAKDISYKEIDKIVDTVKIGAEKLLYLPYLMGERTPHLDPNVRGAFIGLSALHEQKHIMRAVLEGVTYSLRDCLEVLKGMNIEVSDMVACGGGGTSSVWRQMICDTFNCNVKTIASTEGPALGVAILAGVGAGIYSSVEEGCKAVIKSNTNQEPIVENTVEFEKYYGIYKSLYGNLKQSYNDLANL